MPTAIVLGGGLAGLSSAAELGASGFATTVLEARAFLGGRATSYPLPSAEGDPEIIDNCQHILLRCCDALMAFYRRLGVADKIVFHRRLHFLEPSGRFSRFQASLLPAPLHLAASFVRLPFLGAADKWAIARALAAVGREREARTDLDEITMLDWLHEKRQTRRALARFWRPVLVSAVNEELDRMAAAHGLQVMWLGFLASRTGYEMGVPAVPLAELYGSEAWRSMPNVTFELRAPVERILFEANRVAGVRVGGAVRQADVYISCLPFERVPTVAPELGFSFDGWEHAPITGIHLWFDRPVTDLPHAALIDRTIQWFFNKGEGRYLQVVVSASRSLVEMERARVIELAVGELGEFLPSVREAKLVKAHVVKEVHATFSAWPGLEAERPGPVTRFPNLFLAGDWTRTGWPSTMEGAVRSGNAAASAAVLAHRQ